MPDLRWDIAETQLQGDDKQIEAQECAENTNPHPTPALQTMITIAILITMLLANITTYLQGIPETTKKAAQVIKNMTTKISHNKLFQNIKKSYKTAVLVANSTTSMMYHTGQRKQPSTAKEISQKSSGTWKLKDKYNRAYQWHTSSAPSNTYN